MEYKNVKIEGRAEIWNLEDTSVLYVTMSNDNIEKQHALLRMIQEHATIQRYYWVSLYDETVLEYVRPKIYDAYKFEVVAVGSKEQLHKVLDNYNEYVQGIEKATKMLHV